MHDGLPNRHNIAIHRLFDGRHLRTARTQQPPNHGRNDRTRGHGNQSTNRRNVERAGFLRIFNITERKMLNAVQHKRQQASSRANGHSHNRHSSNQCRNSANLWLRSLRILRLLRFSCFCDSCDSRICRTPCTPSPSFNSFPNCPTCRNVHLLRPERGDRQHQNAVITPVCNITTPDNKCHEFRLTNLR